MGWLQYDDPKVIPPGSADVTEPTTPVDVYLRDFSSRALPGQELDVLAPGSWVRGPFPGTPGYNHLPWHSRGIGDLMGRNSGNFYYVGGTSMATPHAASVAAMMLQKNPSLTQSQIESILRATALPMPANDSRYIYDFDQFADVAWDTDCLGLACDPVGAGLIQADQAIALTP
jgi:subtilisin family serine protease